MCSNWIRWHTNITSFVNCKCSLLEHYLPRKNLVDWWFMIKRPYISIGQQLWNQNFSSNNHFNIGYFLWFFILMIMLFSFKLFNYSLLFSCLQCLIILSHFCMSFCLVILSCFYACIIQLFFIALIHCVILFKYLALIMFIAFMFCVVLTILFTLHFVFIWYYPSPFVASDLWRSVELLWIVVIIIHFFVFF